MYKVSKNIKIFSLALMVTGVLGLGFSFYSAPKTVEEAKAMVADSHSDGHHEDETHNSEEATLQMLIHMVLQTFIKRKTLILLPMTSISYTTFKTVHGQLYM